MKASDLGRAAELTADLARLEEEMRRINISTFDIVTAQTFTDERTGKQTQSWAAVSQSFPCDATETQQAARKAIIAMKEAAVNKVRDELMALGVVFDDKQRLPKLRGST